MTWLKGQTTWGNLASDLTKLVCGEIADGSSVTCATGDRWVREYDTTVDAIRSPASKDIASGSCSMRAGYWALTTPNTNGFGHQTFCRQTVIRTAPGTGVRLTYRITINQSNSVANDYSSAQVIIYAWDADSGNYTRSGNSLTLTSAGDASFDGMTIRFGNPTGILTNGASYFRHFTNTYLGGIDYWPMYARRGATATFQTNPPGTTATDWDIVEDCPPYSYCANSTSYSLQCHGWTRSNWGTGLGIKTNTALTGAVYALSFPIALHKIRMFNRTDQAGTLGVTIGRMSLDGSVYRQNAAHEVSSWCRPFQTPAQVTSSSAISYWLSVKPDGIMLVLSGDPGVTGKTSTAHISTITPYDTNYDVLPQMFSQNVTDYTGSNSSTYNAMDMGYSLNYWALRRRLDGTEGARDWQTKWMRCDLMEYGSGWTGQAYSTDLYQVELAWGVSMSTNNGLYGHPSILPLRQLKPHPYDARWWLYGVPYGDGAAWDNSTTPANPGTMDTRQIRGVANTRWWYVPGDGWANLDELTDNSNGNKYMLMAADYSGIGGRHYVTTATYVGGVAIAEV